ncbi:MAG: retroviral-like aspartic protease family protein [Prosthecobacter sp.]|uniref:retroviral-like aspartic protease family protein n=1 Tax=Prosthecobacter sp. TaxID=1965333 RepID=UPI0038FEF252
MSLYRVTMTIADPRDTMRTTMPVDALVDTGSELTWMPAALLEDIGIQRQKKRSFRTATGQTLVRDVGYGLVRAEGFETVDEIVFGEASDMTLLGVRTLEGFGAAVDPLARRMVATMTIAA